MKTMPTGLLKLIRTNIEFERLLKRSLDAIKVYAAQTWSDTGEHDPGVTLLEAYCYGVADLSYRSTLPLTDLLTPPPDQQLADGGIFPADFGPDTALTCGPITEDDYRRALLDLCSADGSDFFFRNVQLVPLLPSDYEYWYDSDSRTFSFVEPSPVDGSEPVLFDLRGNYALYIEPTRNTQKDNAEASAQLTSYLNDNRNLCEAVTQIKWMQPEVFNPEIVIDLDPDVQDVAALLAEIYSTVEAYVSPEAVHQTNDELTRKGLGAEEIYDGPYLQHGWITELPASVDYMNVITVDLSRLANVLLAIDGVQSIESIRTDVSDSWVWSTQAPGHYPQLWGSDPVGNMVRQQYVRLISAGGEYVSATPEEVEAQLSSKVIVGNTPETMPYGNWRDPGHYYPASDKIPPCYGLQQLQPGLAQQKLYQFMLPFEQGVANQCAQLAMLPQSLSFVRAGSTVWGEQWPYQEGSIGDNVHQAYSRQLIGQMRGSTSDYQQEVSVVNDLLGYFGSQCSARMLATSDDEFLTVQQDYLAQHAELGYSRDNIRIDMVSALQKRIAARLGLGANLFDPDCDMSALEFYLVEHRVLLPVSPDSNYDVELYPDSVTVDADNSLIFSQQSVSLDALRTGQLIDLVIKNQSAGGDLRIQALIVDSVDTAGRTFSLSFQQNAQLYLQLNMVLDAQSTGTLCWKNCQNWLQDIDYSLRYADDQSGLDSNSRRLSALSSGPFPAIVQGNDRLRICPILPAGKRASVADDSSTFDVTVTDMDPIGSTLTVQKIDGETGSFPADGDETNYHWYDLTCVDRFSFAVSLIFNKSMLPESGDVHGTDAWIKQAAQQELPADVCAVIHWMDDATFRNFADSYGVWQDQRTVQSYSTFQLLWMLSLGHAPLALSGIGSMKIASDVQRTEVIGADGTEWNVDVIVENGLFFVPQLVVS
nr:hypothetical protein HUO10_005033 [Paraburkholderia busanensis]